MPLKTLQPNFVHSSSILNGHNYQIKAEETVSKESFTNNNSVIITKDIYKSRKQLNLSPFIINLNAYKKKYDKLPKIYFFKGYGENKTIHYELAETLNEFYVLEEQHDRKLFKKELSDLRKQLLWFGEDLGLKN
jgi:hypothetical protein